MVSLTRSSVITRPLRSLVAVRPFSSSVATRSAPVTTGPKHVRPADIVAGEATGPPTLHETAREITADVVSDAPGPKTRFLGSRVEKHGGGESPSTTEGTQAADGELELAVVWRDKRLSIWGTPALRYRPVRIYKPTKTTMQSAKGKTRRWLVDWDTLPGAGRWENPLMGWASSGDYMQGTQMAFPTKEEAVAFVEKQGWAYEVQTPHEPKIPPKNYANNYVHVPGKLRIHHTK